MNVNYILISRWLRFVDGKGQSKHLLIMLIADQLGLANTCSDVFCQGISEIGQGRVSEKSGSFTFYSLWEP